MKTRERVLKHADNFNKKHGVFLYDNKQDEVILNVINLYPHKKTHFFKGKEGEQKRLVLKKKIRETLNKMTADFVYAVGDEAKEPKKHSKLWREKHRKQGEQIKHSALAPTRKAILDLVKINYRGSASKFDLLNDLGCQKLFGIWEKMGGSTKDLQQNIDKGKDLKPLYFGKKFRASAGKNPQLDAVIDQELIDTTKQDVQGVSAIVSAGNKTLSKLLKLSKNEKLVESLPKLRKVDAELDQRIKQEEAIDKTLSEMELKLADEVIKAQEKSFDPIEAIQTNENITADEKAEAVNQIAEELTPETESKIDSKKLLIIALVVGGLFLLLNSNKTSNITPNA